MCQLFVDFHLICQSSGCEALASARLALFGVPFPTREVGRESLCQVVELIFIDTVRELIDLEQTSNVNSTE